MNSPHVVLNAQMTPRQGQKHRPAADVKARFLLRQVHRPPQLLQDEPGVGDLTLGHLQRRRFAVAEYPQRTVVKKFTGQHLDRVRPDVNPGVNFTFFPAHASLGKHPPTRPARTTAPAIPINLKAGRHHARREPEICFPAHHLFFAGTGAIVYFVTTASASPSAQLEPNGAET